MPIYRGRQNAAAYRGAASPTPFQRRNALTYAQQLRYNTRAAAGQRQILLQRQAHNQRVGRVGWEGHPGTGSTPNTPNTPNTPVQPDTPLPPPVDTGAQRRKMEALQKYQDRLKGIGAPLPGSPGHNQPPPYSDEPWHPPGFDAPGGPIPPGSTGTVAMPQGGVPLPGQGGRLPAGGAPGGGQSWIMDPIGDIGHWQPGGGAPGGGQQQPGVSPADQWINNLDTSDWGKDYIRKRYEGSGNSEHIRGNVNPVILDRLRWYNEENPRGIPVADPGGTGNWMPPTSRPWDMNNMLYRGPSDPRYNWSWQEGSPGGRPTSGPPGGHTGYIGTDPWSPPQQQPGGGQQLLERYPDAFENWTHDRKQLGGEHGGGYGGQPQPQPGPDYSSRPDLNELYDINKMRNPWGGNRPDDPYDAYMQMMGMHSGITGASHEASQAYRNPLGFGPTPWESNEDSYDNRRSGGWGFAPPPPRRWYNPQTKQVHSTFGGYGGSEYMGDDQAWVEETGAWPQRGAGQTYREAQRYPNYTKPGYSQWELPEDIAAQYNPWMEANRGYQQAQSDWKRELLSDPINPDAETWDSDYGVGRSNQIGRYIQDRRRAAGEQLGTDWVNEQYPPRPGDATPWAERQDVSEASRGRYSDYRNQFFQTRYGTGPTTDEFPGGQPPPYGADTPDQPGFPGGQPGGGQQQPGGGYEGPPVPGNDMTRDGWLDWSTGGGVPGRGQQPQPPPKPPWEGPNPTEPYPEGPEQGDNFGPRPGRPNFYPEGAVEWEQEFGPWNRELNQPSDMAKAAQNAGYQWVTPYIGPGFWTNGEEYFTSRSQGPPPWEVQHAQMPQQSGVEDNPPPPEGVNPWANKDWADWQFDNNQGLRGWTGDQAAQMNGTVSDVQGMMRQGRFNRGDWDRFMPKSGRMPTTVAPTYDGMNREVGIDGRPVPRVPPHLRYR